MSRDLEGPGALNEVQRQPVVQINSGANFRLDNIFGSVLQRPIPVHPIVARLVKSGRGNKIPQSVLGRVSVPRRRRFFSKNVVAGRHLRRETFLSGSFTPRSLCMYVCTTAGQRSWWWWGGKWWRRWRKNERKKERKEEERGEENGGDAVSLVHRAIHWRLWLGIYEWNFPHHRRCARTISYAAHALRRCMRTLRFRCRHCTGIGCTASRRTERSGVLLLAATTAQVYSERFFSFFWRILHLLIKL